MFGLIKKIIKINLMVAGLIAIVLLAKKNASELLPQQEVLLRGTYPSKLAPHARIKTIILTFKGLKIPEVIR